MQHGNKPIVVDVTQWCIDSGAQQDDGGCAINLALRAADPDLKWVKVTRDEIKFSSRADGVKYGFPTPVEARQFIDKWDVNPEAVEPFQMVLDPRRFYVRGTSRFVSAKDVAQRIRAVQNPRPGTGQKKVPRPLRLTKAEAETEVTTSPEA